MEHTRQITRPSNHILSFQTEIFLLKALTWPTSLPPSTYITSWGDFTSFLLTTSDSGLALSGRKLVETTASLSTPQVGQLFSSCQAKSQLYCEPNGSTASIFYGIWITQSGTMVFILNLDKVSLKKLFPTMNI